MVCAWKSLRLKGDVDHGNSRAKRPASTPAGPQGLLDDSISGRAQTASALLPEFGAVPHENGVMGPALVRGSGPRQPRRPCEKTQWPHNSGLQLSEVPLTYPATCRIQRMLVERSRPSTAAWSDARSRSQVTSGSRPVSSSCWSAGAESGTGGGSHAVAPESPQLVPRATSAKGKVPRHPRGGPLAGDFQTVPDGLEGDSRFDDWESSKRSALSIDPRSPSRDFSPSRETSFLAIEPFASTSLSGYMASDMGDFAPSIGTWPSLPGNTFRSDINKSILADSWLEGSVKQRNVHDHPHVLLRKGDTRIQPLLAPSTETSVEWVSSFVSKAPSFSDLPQRPSKSSMSPPLPRVTSAPSLPGKRLKGRVCQAALIGAHSEMRRLGNPYLQQLALEAASPPKKEGCRTGCACCPHLESLRPRVPRREDGGTMDEMAYMDKVISSREDTPDSLRGDIETLHASHEPIHDDLGGARHPTTLVFARALKITQRKLSVLSTLVDATRQFEAMSSRKAEVIKAVISGQTPEEAGGVAIGYLPKVKNSIHATPYGCPEDADKSFFDFFSSTMKLSQNHVAVVYALALHKAEIEPWVDALAYYSREQFEKEVASGDESSDSPAAEAIRRLFKLSDGLSLPEEHPKLIETEQLGNAAKARKVRVNAEAEWRILEESKSPSKAREAALRVEMSVKNAIKWGLEKNHPDVRTALSVSHDLHGRSVLLMAEDEFRLMKSRNRLGDAEQAAVRIEDFIKDCLAMGVPVTHPELEASRKIAIKFREEEGIRKRQANRDKQLAEKAAKEAAAA